MRIQGRDQVAFAKGASLGCRAVPHTVVAVGAGGALSRPGCGPAESEGASLRRGVSDRGPQMSLSLLGGGGGTPDPPISRPQPSRVGRSGDFRRLAPGAPWAPTWDAWRGPLAHVPRRQRSSGASYLLCSSSSTRSPWPPVGQSVCQSQRESARRLTPWPPRGARTPRRPPRPPARAGLRAARRASGGAGREPPGWAGRNGEGRGRERGAREAVAGAARGVAFARDSARSAGQVGARSSSLQGRGRAGRAPGRGGGASAPRVGRRPGQRPASRPLRVPAPQRTRCALGAAPLLPPRLRPLLDVSSRWEEGFFFFPLSALSGIAGDEGRGVPAHI